MPVLSKKGVVKIRKTNLLALLFFTLILSGTAIAVPTIDGIISPLEWDAYLLGTSVTGWEGGMSVDVYGVVDGGFLYAAYVADTSQPGWDVACGLNVNSNLYYKTPQSASFPDPGYTIFEMDPSDYMQTDGSDWAPIGLLSSIVGLEQAYINMYSVDDTDCSNGITSNNVAEFKIPLGIITYAGNDNQIRLSGQYWQYDFATPFYLTINPPVIVEPTKDSKVALAQASANFGTGRYMMVNDKKNAVDRSYLGFNLSTFAHPSVSNAELRIYVFQTGNTAIGSAIEAWHCSNADFNELTINWKNQPAAWKPNGVQVGNKCALADSYSVANKVMYGLPETFHSWDLTSEVNSALAGNKSFTVVLKHDTETAATNKNYVQYLTRDYPESDFRPQLILS